jgi:hypothetical protein
MWLVSWLAAPHMRLDLAVEDPNAKNIIFCLLSYFAACICIQCFRRASSMSLILSLSC